MRAFESQERGFTLIELMIVTVVIALLTMIALPSYNESVARAHRNDARAQLNLAATYMDRLRNERGTYQPGGNPPTLPGDLAVSPRSGTTRYNISVTAVTDLTYTLTATAVGPMANDDCGNLAVDNTGLRSYSGTAGTVSRCLDR
jgi:type IV pilus assembly protein PilE